MDLINEIRRKNGMDEDMLRRAARDPEILSAMRATAENLEQALKNLSDELYTKSTHFVFEFVQNADDNTYTDPVPTLHMQISDRTASFHCNEVGFTQENVEAICRVGASTKKDIHGYIGEKGIGFKSVFKVANEVFISSGNYTFKLDKREKLGMITPSWSEQYPAAPGWTSFYLHLSGDGKQLAEHVEDIQPSLLLFLRKLRSLTVEIVLGSVSRNLEIHRYETPDPDVVNIKRGSNGNCVSSDTFLMVKHAIKPFQLEPKRSNIQETDIILAFPITEEGDPVIKMQEVHAFLPLRKFGFSFLIQADFLTSSSREDVLSDSLWNNVLRAGVVSAFVKAVEAFKGRPSLDYAWIRYLPNHVSDSFFGLLQTMIIQRLRHLPTLLSTDDVYRLPSEVVILTARFRDSEGLPLVPERFLPSGVYYLSPAYYSHVSHLTSLTDLGVVEMTDEIFLRSLQRMEGEYHLQSDDWHEALSATLNYRMEPSQKHKLKSLFLRLRLLPLNNGTFAPMHDASAVFFDLQVAGVPDDLGLVTLKSGLNPHSARYRFFQDYGVRPAEPVVIAGKLLSIHNGGLRKDIALATLINHTKFMFAYRTLLHFPPPTNLLVMGEDCVMSKGLGLYMDIPGREFQLRDILPRPPARFIHLDYLNVYPDETQQEFQVWLENSLLINTFPRVITGGLSPEFEAMLKTLDSHDLLIVLKEHWDRIQLTISGKGIDAIAKTMVKCVDGSLHPLQDTYIKRQSLLPSQLPFLPIDQPEDSAWDFLSVFGVSTEVNGLFYMKRLSGLQRAGSEDEVVIRDTYTQLQARFSDDPGGIQEVFQREPLFFVPRSREVTKWVDFSQVVWSGPHSMKSKISLRDAYPFLEDLFRSKLRVPDPPIYQTLLIEMDIALQEWKSGAIPKSDTKKQIFDILFEFNSLIRLMKPHAQAPDWLVQLTKKTIFPVDDISGRLVLLKPGDNFYISDHPKYEKMFRNIVPLLSIERSQLPRLKSLLEFHGFRPPIRYLDSSVARQSVATGRRIFDSAATGQYAGRLEYIRRIVHFAQLPEPSLEIMKRLESMQNLAIFAVDRIQTTFSIDNTKKTITDHTTVEEGVNKFVILVSHDCSRPEWDARICSMLGKLLEIDKDKLQSIVLMPRAALAAWLDIEGVPELAPDPAPQPELPPPPLNNPQIPHQITPPTQPSPQVTASIPEFVQEKRGNVARVTEPTPSRVEVKAPAARAAPETAVPRAVSPPLAYPPPQLPRNSPLANQVPKTPATSAIHETVSWNPGSGPRSRMELEARVENNHPIATKSSDIKRPFGDNVVPEHAPLKPPVLPKEGSQIPSTPPASMRARSSVSKAYPTEQLQRSPAVRGPVIPDYGNAFATQEWNEGVWADGGPPRVLFPKSPSVTSSPARTPRTPRSSLPALRNSEKSSQVPVPPQRLDSPVIQSRESFLPPLNHVQSPRVSLPRRPLNNPSQPKTENSSPVLTRASSQSVSTATPVPPADFPRPLEAAAFNPIPFQPQTPAPAFEALIAPDFVQPYSLEADPTAYEQGTGIIGEHLVFNLFSRDLPGFGPDNWTSELRGLVPGFLPYDASAIADFTYHDHHGVLTSLWFGPPTAEAWAGRWPVYHIEVKSTSGAANEVFHVSSRQLEIARNLTTRNPHHMIPEEVYVLFRVSGVRTPPVGFGVYIDPHLGLYEGRLQIVNDVHMVASM